MTEAGIEAAADALWANWVARSRIPSLPADAMPESRAEAYRIQAHVERRSSQPIAGWKVAATSSAGQAHINVDGPLAGRLLVERGHPPGTELVIGNSIMRVAEPEFAFRIGDSLASRDVPYEVDEVMASVSSLHPSIEIPDSRFEDFTVVGALQLIADNACAHEYVVGPAADDGWRSVDLARHPVRIGVQGGPGHDGVGASALGDPRAALTWLVNEVTGIGETISAGQIVMTGTCAVPMPVEPGHMVVADFGLLGRLEVALV